ncbi:MAG: macrolide ABC transporter ATP-binding protein [marine bacterium B5-7]|nr:MAG: macrolide ABC transporter ATP-binding protein [marine bacterium B5-7]
MIKLHRVSKIYEVGDQPVYALADITEHIKAGEYVAIMGPSGSGKSTLLNLLGCLLRPTEGSYQLNGKDINTLSDAELSKLRQSVIGFIFQSFHLIPRLTAAGNVELPMIFAGITPQERQQRVAEALEAVGLTARSHHRPDQLSVGQRQRVVIARATVMNPRLILADEPTGNLDSESGKQILELLDRLYSLGHTLIVVTHDIDVAHRAERLLVISDGHIVQRTSSSSSKNMTSVATPPSS